MVAAGLRPVDAEVLQDWGTNRLNTRHLEALTIGCKVRVAIENTANAGWEKIYFKIIRIKDGTYWGEATDTYRSTAGYDVGISDGEVMTFRRRHIMEIPMGKLWQPKAYVRAVEWLPTAAEPEDDDDD